MKKKSVMSPSKKTGGKKIGLIILGVFLTIIAIVGSIVGIISSKNIKAMNSCVDAVLIELQKHYTVTPIDVGEYKEMKLFGIMKFHVEQYNIEELGNLSIMRTNMGVMQMATVVITPKDKNLPLLSADYMYILSNRKSYLEFYDVVKEKDAQYTQLTDKLLAIKENYSHLKKLDMSPAWYDHLLTVQSCKSGTTADDPELKNMLMDSLRTYIEHDKQLAPLSAEEKAEKIAITVDYTDGLIEKGGISTDVFKKELGNEETKLFFDTVFFGTALQ